MKIIALKIKNFLSISDVEIQPKKINQITGFNNNGKTSILKAIEFAIRGSNDRSLVKFGTESGEVVIELDDSTMIRRRINSEGKQTVKVSREGFDAKSPQALLDSLFDTSAFNPLELLDPKKRTDAILNSIDIKVDEAKLQSFLTDSPLIKIPLPPLDYTQHGLKVIDQAHKYFYQRRAEANKDAADKKKRWETYLSDLPKDEPQLISREQVQGEYDGLMIKFSHAKTALIDIQNEHNNAKKAHDRLSAYIKAVEDIDKEIGLLKSRRDEGLRFVEKAKLEVPSNLRDPQKAKDLVASLEMDLEKTKAKFVQIDKGDAIGKQKTMVDAMNKDFIEAQNIADTLTKRVEALAGPIKKKLMECAEMPVAGLEFKDGAFLIESVPIENLSSSKALKLAIAVARKLSKRSKIICVDGLELLDEENYNAMRKEIENDGFVYFLTAVGEGFNNTTDKKIKMENGVAIQ